MGIGKIQSAMLLGGAALLITGCVHYQRTPFDPSAGAPPPESPGTTPYLEYDRRPIEYEIHTHAAQFGAYHSVEVIAFPSAGDNGQPGNMVRADYYKAHGPGAHRLVIVLPIWGRELSYPVRRLTENLTSNLPDTHVLILRGPEHLIDWYQVAEIESEAEFHRAIDDFVERIRVNMIDIRRILDWAEQRPEIDHDRIGVVGFSVSATMAGALLANEPRFEAAVLAMGAARPDLVLAHCGGRRKMARKELMDRFGWTLEDYTQVLTDAFAALDASYKQPGLDPRRVLMFDARLDLCMPRHTREEFWERLGKPERITITATHRAAFAAMSPFGFNVMTVRMRRFIEETL